MLNIPHVPMQSVPPQTRSQFEAVNADTLTSQAMWAVKSNRMAVDMAALTYGLTEKDLRFFIEFNDRQHAEVMLYSAMK